jgi:hypothetical protein
MPGTQYFAVRKTLYDFASLPGSGSASLVIARAVDVSQYALADMILRVHSVNLAGSAGTGSIQLLAYTEAPTTEDPGTEFVLGSANANSISINLTTSYTTPTVNYISLATPFGAYLRLVLKGTQPSSAFTTFQVTISADLIPKS